MASVDLKPVRESTATQLQVSYNLDSIGANLDHNLIVKVFLPKRPPLQIKPSGVESENKNEGAPLCGVHGADETISPLLQEIPIVVV